MASKPEKRRRGRPSLEAERRDQIVSVFIELVAERGLEHTSLADIAEASGLHRSALRYFVGNRDELIQAAIDQISNTYGAAFDSPMPPLETIKRLFDMSGEPSFEVADRAWAHLLPEAVRTPGGRAGVKMTYDHLMAVVGDALRRQYPNASRARVADAAYTIACLVECNFMFQRLGYPRARSKAVQAAALALFAQFN